MSDAEAINKLRICDEFAEYFGFIIDSNNTTIYLRTAMNGAIVHSFDNFNTLHHYLVGYRDGRNHAS